MILECSAIRPWLAAFADAERTVVPAQALQVHLEGCASCTEELRRLRALRNAVAAAYELPDVPEGLARRIGWTRFLARLGRRLGSRAPTRGRTAGALDWLGRFSSLDRMRRSLGAVATLALTAGLVIAGVVVSGQPTGAAPNSEEEAVALYDALAEGTLALDLRESDPDRLSTQLSARLGREIRFTQVGRSGLALEGARYLDAGDGGAMVMFRGQGRRVGLSVRPVSHLARSVAPINFAHATVRGHRVIAWEHGAVQYTLVAGRPEDARSGCATCHAPGDAAWGAASFDPGAP